MSSAAASPAHPLASSDPSMRVPPACDGASILSAERAKASFNVRELTHLLNGSRELTERKEQIAAAVERDPVFSQHDRYFLDRQETFRRTLHKITHANSVQASLELNSLFELWWFRACVNSMSPFTLHDGMFIPAIMGQASEEQKARWLGPAMNKEILGCYAQTELGHGSNVQGLETLATYDPATESFDLHSPTLTATKWWPGALGMIATHALVHARLILRGKDLGVHTFFVQIRDEQHRPLPGIVVGDIGPKFGFQSVDNGFLRFDHVRIPRANMLSRYAKVSPSGDYTQPAHAKLGYLTMVGVRNFMIRGAADSLARASTIAIRYSAVRRQFGPAGEASAQELQVLDYQQQMHCLFPLLAAAYAMQFTAMRILVQFDDLQARINSPEQDLSVLPEFHATVSGLKAVVTQLTGDGIEECRKRCGGHGYSLASGLPTLLADYVAASTYEGDSHVLLQQTARYLIKAAQDVSSGKKAVGSTAYLSAPPPLDAATLLTSGAAQSAAFALRARHLILSAAAEYRRQLASAQSEHAAWNNCMVSLIKMAKAHCHYALVSNFVATETQVQDPAIRAVLGRLRALFALHLLETNLGDFLLARVISAETAQSIPSAISNLLFAVRPDAIALVDAFNYPDFLLCSELGRKDGNVYQSLYAWALRAPANQAEYAERAGVKEFILPLLNKDLLRSRL